MEELSTLHRKENKDLQAQIQTLKKGVPKSDRQKKVDVQNEIQMKIQKELEARHEHELVAVITASPPERHQASQDNPVPRITKAARRREKAAANAKALAAAVEYDKSKHQTSLRGVEFSKLETTLAKRGLALFKIPSDGDCLYASVAHQLEARSLLPLLNAACSHLQLPPAPPEAGYAGVKQALRKLTAASIRQHPDEFLPFIIADDNSPDPLIAYCKQVETPGVWGGQLELRAISSALSIPIEVIQADVPTIHIGDSSSEPPMIITYHHFAYLLGEHYNSTIAMPSK